MDELPPGTQVKFVAFALLRRWFEEEARWLVRHDSLAQEWQMLEAECLQGESYRETLDRELVWQLNLQRGKDYLISSVPRLHLEFPSIRRTCSGAEELTIEIVELYLVELFGAAGRETLDENEAVQWWTVSELLSDASANRHLSSRQRELLRTSDVFSGCVP